MIPEVQASFDKRRFGARVVIGKRSTEVQATFKHILDLSPTFATTAVSFLRPASELGEPLPAPERTPRG